MEITLIDNLAWFTEEAVSDAQKKHPNDKSAQVASVKRQLARWEREYGRSPTAADAAPQAPGFVGEFDFPRLRKMLDECVRSLNDVVVAQTKDDGFDMPVGMWKAIEQADYLVNSARDAIPVRTVIRYPAWLDVYVDTAVDDHRITKVTAMTQGSDAGNLSTKTSGFALEHEDADVADSVLRFTDRASWPDPKLEG